MLSNCKLRRWVPILSVGLLLGCFAADANEVERHERNYLQAAKADASHQSADVEEGSFAWPQWRGPNRDGISPETGLLARWSENGPRILWRRSTSGPGYSGLAIDAGRLYTMMQDGEYEAVVCWDALTGKEIWRYRYPARFVSDQGSGPRATPTVSLGKVYAVGATGWLHCLDARTGNLIWRRDLVGEIGGRIPDWGVSFSPLVADGLVFTQPGGPRGNSLVAFDADTGAIRWRSLDDRPGYASPMLTTGAGVRQVLFFTAEALVSVQPENGRLYWRYPWETSMDCNIATPIVVGDYVFISSGYGRGGALLRILPEQGGAVHVAVVYRTDRMRNHFSTSVFYDGYLYGFDETRLTCMEFLTGQVRWQVSGFRKGSLIAADDKLIVLGENGRLALARASPGGFRPTGVIRLSRLRHWTPPSLANGLLYIRNEEEIVCIDLRRGF